MQSVDRLKRHDRSVRYFCPNATRDSSEFSGEILLKLHTPIEWFNPSSFDAGRLSACSAQKKVTRVLKGTLVVCAYVLPAVKILISAQYRPRKNCDKYVSSRRTFTSLIPSNVACPALSAHTCRVPIARRDPDLSATQVADNRPLKNHGNLGSCASLSSQNTRTYISPRLLDRSDHERSCSKGYDAPCVHIPGTVRSDCERPSY